MASSSISPERMREYSGDLLRNVAISFLVLETVAVGLRFASLRLSGKRFGLDDILTLPGYICCLGLIILSFVGINVGRIGYHLDVVEATDPQAIIPWGKCLYATPIIYSAACCFPRIILLTFYLQIFEKRRPYRWACYGLMGLVVAFAVADMFAGAFECWPVAYLWNKDIEGGHCDNIPVFYRWGTLPNVIIDFMMLALPQPIVWTLQVSTQVKVGLAMTFLTGSIGMITSICRCVSFFQNNPLEDGTWLSVTFLKWSIIEPGVYLIAACLPCYRPLIKFALERSRTGFTSRYYSKNSTASCNSPTQKVSMDISNRVIRKQTDIEMAIDDRPRRTLTRDSDEQNLVEHRI